MRANFFEYSYPARISAFRTPSIASSERSISYTPEDMFVVSAERVTEAQPFVGIV